MNDPTLKSNAIEEMLSEHGDCDVPPEIAARARVHLDALRERMEKRESGTMTMKNGIGFHWRRLLALATPVAALAIAALIFWGPLNNRGASAYAAAVRRIKEAQNLIVSCVARIQDLPETKMEIAANKAGCMRIDMMPGMHSVVDPATMKTVSIDDNQKMVIVLDLKNVPMEKTNDPRQFIEQLRSLPERASEQLGMKNLGGRVVQGYRVKDADQVSEVWLDAGTREIVQVDQETPKMAGVKVTMTNFRFDAPLAADYFSTAVPPGYKTQTMNMDLGNPVAEDFIGMIKTFSIMSPDGNFPPSVNPADLAVWGQKNKLHIDMKKAQEMFAPKDEAKNGQKTEAQKMEDAKKAAMEGGQRAAKGMIFIMGMKPENDWHYAGKGVKVGDAQTPIAWWKPKDSKNYMVVLGDLSVKEVPSEEMPKTTAPGSPAPKK